MVTPLTGDVYTLLRAHGDYGPPPLISTMHLITCVLIRMRSHFRELMIIQGLYLLSIHELSWAFARGGVDTTAFASPQLKYIY